MQSGNLPRNEADDSVIMKILDAINTGNDKELTFLYSEDAELHPPNKKMVKGR